MVGVEVIFTGDFAGSCLEGELIKGKVYINTASFGQKDSVCVIINENGTQEVYAKCNFKTRDQVRDNKLQELLNDN